MKTDEASKKALKHIICCLIILLIFIITITKVDAKNESDSVMTTETEDVVPLSPQLDNRLLNLNKLIIEESESIKYNQPRVIEKNIEYYINEQIDTITFFANIFGYDIEYIKEDLIKRSENIENLEPTNIGSIKNQKGVLKKYNNKEYGAVEYFYELVESHPEKRNKKEVAYSGNSDYIEKLIMYYTQIYTNVDTTTALSIGAAESGYYKVNYMLRKNNVYGGMSSNGLIRHENIEIGVLKYVRMLSKNYYGKGLTTLESIGRVYCPIINEYGNKVASPHWINLVNTAKTKYKKYTGEITIQDILNEKELQQ